MQFRPLLFSPVVTLRFKLSICDSHFDLQDWKHEIILLDFKFKASDTWSDGITGEPCFFMSQNGNGWRTTLWSRTWYRSLLLRISQCWWREVLVLITAMICLINICSPPQPPHSFDMLLKSIMMIFLWISDPTFLLSAVTVKQLTRQLTGFSPGKALR